VSQDEEKSLSTGPLGLSGDYAEGYSVELLHPMPRAEGRKAVGLDTGSESELAHLGKDLWTGYEFSWLDTKGKPVVAGLKIEVDCATTNIVESKSMKLYLNGFAQAQFADAGIVSARLNQDLSTAFAGDVVVDLIPIDELAGQWASMRGQCLDGLDIQVTNYQRAPELLGQMSSGSHVVTEHLYTHLFRSLCPVTAQPDWATVTVSYTGNAIDHAGLLGYLISYRCHQAFHETTVERIYADIMGACQPTFLSVNGRFQRRGGLDINPFRSSEACPVPDARMPRQ
jgi:7-cyano-7-deazaguanine reductase|tara:strand:- start:152 stop:1003 length:852 start_codon:yes stop_codon:yes gene_type:complete